MLKEIEYFDQSSDIFTNSKHISSVSGIKEMKWNGDKVNMVSKQGMKPKSNLYDACEQINVTIKK